jgi:hypothetical protein
MIKPVVSFFILVWFTSCSSLLNYKKTKDFKNIEFEKKVVIEETNEEKVDEATSTTEPVNSLDANATFKDSTVPVKQPIDIVKASKDTSIVTVNGSTMPAFTVAAIKKPVKEMSVNLKSKKASSKAQKASKIEVSLRRQPDIEDSEGFNNLRRPPVDPFRVGEKVIHEVSYLGAKAGTLVLKVNPFAVVNGQKSYNFTINLKSTSFFSKVFAVDDKVQTYVDYEKLVPHVFKLDIRDSGQVKEAQAYYDIDNLKADYWEHRYTEKSGHEEKKLSWSILPYSQNPFSAIFYMRIFNFIEGREYSFRVADDEKNVLFKAKALQKVSLKTDVGTFNAIKLKAEVYSSGNLAKASDFYIWVSDDDRKYILRIEVKLPFGSIVSEVTEVVAGNP